MTRIAVSCRGLVKRYSDVVAVDGIDLDVHAGECFGLLGPNGAGKTTTVEILEGINAPDAGTVNLLGRSWTDEPERASRADRHPAPGDAAVEKLTVLETITLFRSFYPKGLDPREVMRIVRLEEKREGVGPQTVRGPEATALPGGRARGGSRDPLPRRADDGARSTGTPPGVGRDRRREGARRHGPC
jgi:ABC-type multidrug transport system ATPase subunit